MHCSSTCQLDRRSLSGQFKITTISSCTKLGSIPVEQTVTQTSPEGIFNPEIPRDRPFDIVIAYFKGNVSDWDRPRTVLQKHQSALLDHVQVVVRWPRPLPSNKIYTS